jgi:Ca2+-binding RTX toxin-like protein
MRASFGSAINFSTFDLSHWADRTGTPSLATGSFTLNGVTYENRYLLRYEDGGNPFVISLLGNEMTQAGGFLVDGTIGVIRLLAGPAGTTTLISMQNLNLSADALHDAIRSASASDDRALLTQMLAGNDWINLSGQADRAFGANGNDTLFGNAGGDFLSGNNGMDWLYGGDGADTLNGQSGADRLFGGAGTDRLVGGLGADALTGGAAADTFRFTSADGNDVIRDFQDNVDTIDIDIIPAGEWQVDLQPHDGDTVLTIFRVGDPKDLLGLQIVIENINPTQMTDDILV